MLRELLMQCFVTLSYSVSLHSEEALHDTLRKYCVRVVCRYRSFVFMSYLLTLLILSVLGRCVISACINFLYIIK